MSWPPFQLPRWHLLSVAPDAARMLVQLAHYEAFGFLVFRQLLSPPEIARYSIEFDAGMAAVRCMR